MSEWIPFATLLKPHGVKGAIKVRTDSDFKDARYTAGAVLKCATKTETIHLTVESYHDLSAGEVLKFVECNDRDAAFLLRGSTLYFDASSRDPLEDDAFYYDQLEGASVLLGEQIIGTVKALHDYPQGTMLRIATEAKDVLVPFMKVFVQSVDLKTKTIILNPWEGLV